MGWLVGSAQEIMKNSRHLVFWEMAILVASVLVFRGLWLLLDTFEWLSRPAGLWASLAAGMIAAAVATATAGCAAMLRQNLTNTSELPIGPGLPGRYSDRCNKTMTESIWLWVGFNVFVLAMLALDLGVFHRKSHVVSLKESLT